MTSAEAAPFGLSRVSLPDLQTLTASLERGQLTGPLTATALESRGLGHLTADLEPYSSLDNGPLLAVLRTVLAERHHRRAPKLTLVWTGDDPGTGQSRYTRILLPEMFSGAREHVLVAGYSFGASRELFGPLHTSMLSHGTTATFFVDIHQLIERLKGAAKAGGKDWGILASPLHATTSALERGRAAVALFYQLMWPFGPPFPRLFFDPRTAAPFSVVSLHAKCVVIDHKMALVTSANFTERGQKRNIEAGVAIEDGPFAITLETQWSNLVEAGVVVEGA